MKKNILWTRLARPASLIATSLLIRQRSPSLRRLLIPFSNPLAKQRMNTRQCRHLVFRIFRIFRTATSWTLLFFWLPTTIEDAVFVSPGTVCTSFSFGCQATRSCFALILSVRYSRSCRPDGVHKSSGRMPSQ